MNEFDYIKKIYTYILKTLKRVSRGGGVKRHSQVMRGKPNRYDDIFFRIYSLCLACVSYYCCAPKKTELGIDLKSLKYVVQ